MRTRLFALFAALSLFALLALPAAALMRDIAFYTSYRAGGSSPTEAMTQLPSFGRAHEGDRVMGVAGGR